MKPPEPVADEAWQARAWPTSVSLCVDDYPPLTEDQVVKLHAWLEQWLMARGRLPSRPTVEELVTTDGAGVIYVNGNSVGALEFGNELELLRDALRPYFSK